MSDSLNAHEQRALEMIRAGNKLGAIKELREATGMGLGEAKAAVDRLEAGGQMPASQPTRPVELSPEVVDLAKQGKSIEAIKLLRERTGASLKDAKQLVDSVPLEAGARRSGCAGLVLLGIGLSGAFLLS